jgi:hypothetical protein
MKDGSILISQFIIHNSSLKPRVTYGNQQKQKSGNESPRAATTGRKEVADPNGGFIYNPG